MRGARKLPGIMSACGVLLLSSACTTTDFERGAFDSLMRLQCEDIEARGSCNRSFAPEFQAWRDSREAYLEELARARAKKSPWPGDFDTDALPDL